MTGLLPRLLQGASAPWPGTPTALRYLDDEGLTSWFARHAEDQWLRSSTQHGIVTSPCIDIHQAGHQAAVLSFPRVVWQPEASNARGNKLHAELAALAPWVAEVSSNQGTAGQPHWARGSSVDGQRLTLGPATAGSRNTGRQMGPCAEAAVAATASDASASTCMRAGMSWVLQAACRVQRV